MSRKKSGLAPPAITSVGTVTVRTRSTGIVPPRSSSPITSWSYGMVGATASNPGSRLIASTTSGGAPDSFMNRAIASPRPAAGDRGADPTAQLRAAARMLASSSGP